MSRNVFESLLGTAGTNMFDSRNFAQADFYSQDDKTQSAVRLIQATTDAAMLADFDWNRAADLDYIDEFFAKWNQVRV